MDDARLMALSPLDGRYKEKTQVLERYFSEFALMKYRVRVEIEYFLRLCALPLPQLAAFDAALIPSLRDIYLSFSLADAQRIKEIERTTNHDVKAVEYFIKECFDALDGAQPYKEFIHFGLTSQDINNTAFPLMLHEAWRDVLLPHYTLLLQQLETRAAAWADVSMLAHTHGQPASPTRLGKEIKVFAYRLHEQLEQTKRLPITVKFGGATGNFNAHHAAYPAIDWHAFANAFVSDTLGLVREQFTTQISNYDALAAFCDALRRQNTILIDLARDMWMYIALGYFKQKIKAGEVGSSAMPHKVNPIDFENAEGNLGMANAILVFLAQKLPVSRLQRDLTDSTVLRNIGVPLAHTLLAITNILTGLNKLIINDERINDDLNSNWAVVSEAIQTILRREGYPQPYEALKALTRTNERVTRATLAAFIEGLDVADDIKNELKSITPQNYTGI